MSEIKPNRSYPAVFHNLPRNDEDYQGGYVLYSTSLNRFFVMVFGTGDNLTQEDIEGGYDDYMMIGAFQFNGREALMTIVCQIQEGADLEDIAGLNEIDSVQMLIRRREYGNTGDARAYIANALEMMEYGCEEEGCMYKDLLFISKVK